MGLLTDDDGVVHVLLNEIRQADEWTGTNTTWEGEYELVTIQLRRHIGPVPGLGPGQRHSAPKH